MPSRLLLMLIPVLVVAGITAAGASDARADQYRRYHARPYYRPHTRVVAVYPHGLYVGGGLTATRILDQEGGSELLGNGGGLGLHTGLRLNQQLAVEAGWMGTLHNPYRVSTPFGDDIDYLVLNGFTLDAKILFPSAPEAVGRPGRLEPFVQAGVGLYLLGSTSLGAQSVGAGFQLGGGLRYQAGQRVNLGLRALYRGMAMGPPDAGYSDTYVSAATVEATLELEL